MASGDLEILRLLGEGGHGAVYLARHRGSLGFERLVALKVVRPNTRLPEVVATRFVHEARLLGLLRHRAIVTADDVVELDIGTAIVMEYIPGIDLFDLLRLNHTAPGTIPVSWMAHVGLEVASALSAAWRSPSALTGQPLRVLHCDVKPSNVRISASGEVKLLDFGVSTSLIDDTADGPVMGTLGYVAPERLEGGRTGPASDLFSLGLTLLAVARGRGMTDRPVDAIGVGAWVARVLPELPSAYSPLLGVLRDLLSTDASLRPDHDEVRARLFAVLRAHADAPPADLAAQLVARARSSTAPMDGPAATALDSAPARPPTRLPRTIDESADAALPARTLTEPGFEPPRMPSPPSPARGLAPPPRPPPPGSAPPPPPMAARAPALDATTHPEPSSLDASSDADRADYSRIVASWLPSDGHPPLSNVPPRAAREYTGPSARVFAAAAELSGWFDLEQAQAVLGPELQRTGQALPRVLDQLVREGALQGTQLEGVAHARLAPGQAATAAHALARWPPDARNRLIARHVAHLLQRTSDTWLDRMCEGIGPSEMQLDGLERDLERMVNRGVSGSVGCGLALAVIRADRAELPQGAWAAFDALLRDPAATARDRVRIRRWRGQFTLDATDIPPERSLEQVDQTIDAAKAVGDRVNEAAAWGQRGVWLLRLGEREEAIEALSRSRTMSEELGDALRGCIASAHLVLPLARTGRRDEARRLARTTERICRELGARRLHATLLATLADHSREAGDTERATRYGSRAVHAAQALNRAEPLATALCSRGLVYLEAGDLEGAAEDLREAQAYFDERGGLLHAWTTGWLAGALLRQGDLDGAASELAAIGDRRDRLFGDSAVVVDAWTAQVRHAQGDLRGARAVLVQAEGAMEELAELVSPSVRRLIEATRGIVGAR